MDITKLPFKNILLTFHIVSTYSIFFNQLGYSFMIISLITQILIMWSHYQVVNTQPGPIINTKLTPIDIMLEEKLQLNFVIRNEKQLQNKCNTCDGNWKPPKTHHCSTCNKCVHYRDHHCIWFNCCIGYKNLKYFCQFLTYFSIITVIHGFTILIWLFNQIQEFHQAGFINFQWSYVYYSLSFSFLLKMPQLFIVYFGYQIATGLLKDKCVQLPDLSTYQDQKENKYMYYKDFKWKLERLLGKNILLWILPLPNKFNLNYLELLYPKVTTGDNLLDYYLYTKDKDYFFYKKFEIND